MRGVIAVVAWAARPCAVLRRDDRSYSVDISKSGASFKTEHDYAVMLLNRSSTTDIDGVPSTTGGPPVPRSTIDALLARTLNILFECLAKFGYKI